MTQDWLSFMEEWCIERMYLDDDKKRSSWNSQRSMGRGWLQSRFRKDINGVIGNPHPSFFKDVNLGAVGWCSSNSQNIILLFQLMFAVITPGLVEQLPKESALPLIFFSLYYLACCVCSSCTLELHPDGFLAKMGALDFAGNSGSYFRRLCRWPVLWF
jgi:hypothetical protein